MKVYVRLIVCSGFLSAAILTGLASRSYAQTAPAATTRPVIDTVGGATVGPGEITILPLGDSITKGAVDSAGDGYRRKLAQSLTAAGVKFRFVGATNVNSSKALTAIGQQWHDGFGTYRIDDLLRNFDGVAQPGRGDSSVGGFWMPGGKLLPYQGRANQPFRVTRPIVRPDVVLLLAGANDIAQKADVPTLQKRTDALLDWFAKNRPAAKIFVGTLTPYKDQPRNEVVRQFNAWLKEAIPKVAPGRVMLVDIGAAVAGPDGAYEPTLMADQVHPNHAGYDALADAWMKSLVEAGVTKQLPGKETAK